MKKMISALLISFIAVLQASSANVAAKDTIIRYNGKSIHVEDSVGRMKIKVFESTSKKDSVEYKQLFEGIYTEDKSFEKWTVIEEVGLQLPFLNKVNERHHKHNYKMEPHWAGIGWGYLNVANSSLNLNAIDGVRVKAENSNQWFLNISERILPIYKNTLGLTTGLGFSWARFYLDNNKHFVENETTGKTGIENAPTGVHYDYSRLRIVQINIPLLLEWQPNFGVNHKFFMTAGVVGGINIGASSKVKYTDTEGNTVKKTEDRGLNTTPLSLDYMAQIGYKKWSVYAKYSPFSVFQSDKGPKVHAASLGLMLHF